MIEQDLKEHFERLADDTPNVDAMRSRIQSKLASPPSDTSLGSRRRWPLQVAAAALMIAVGWAGAQVLDSPSGTQVDAVGSPLTESPIREPATINGTKADVSDFVVPFAVTLPEPAMTVEIVTTRSRVVALSDTANLHIVSPPSTNVQEVEKSILNSLSDTLVESVGPSHFGGFVSQRLVLSSDRGTTEVGFQIGFSTYLVTSGIDQAHEVHIVEVDSGAAEPDILVFWLAAPTQELVDVQELAERIVSTVDFDV